MEQWRIKISGQQRKVISVDLLVQAVLALGRQLRDEAQAAAASEQRDMQPAPADNQESNE